MLPESSIFDGIVPAIFGGIIGMASSAAAWYASDVRSKIRIELAKEELVKLEAKVKEGLDKNNESIGSLVVSHARSETDRDGIHRQLDNKASRETVEGLRTELTQIRQDIERGFDRMERKIESIGNNRNNTEK
jgi:phage shock protein A